MAILVAPQFPEVDQEKLIKMCLIHDFGEAVTGDIPSFYKTAQDEEHEATAVAELLKLLPEGITQEFAALFAEMAKRNTAESKLFHALDNLEGVISHNEAPLETWIPLEHTENLTYGTENAAYSEYLRNLREELKQDSIKKISNTLYRFQI